MTDSRPYPSQESPQYSEEQVRGILQIAIARKASRGEYLSREQVGEIAAELGVSHEDLQAAEQEWQTAKIRNQEQQAFDTYARHQFRDALGVYAIVNLFLVGINFTTSHHLSWAVYPLLGWGLAIALKAWATFQTNSAAYQKQFEQWRRKQKQQELVNRLANKATEKLQDWLK